MKKKNARTQDETQVNHGDRSINIDGPSKSPHKQSEWISRNPLEQQRLPEYDAVQDRYWSMATVKTWNQHQLVKKINSSSSKAKAAALEHGHQNSHGCVASAAHFQSEEEKSTRSPASTTSLSAWKTDDKTQLSMLPKRHTKNTPDTAATKITYQQLYDDDAALEIEIVKSILVREKLVDQLKHLTKIFTTATTAPQKKPTNVAYQAIEAYRKVSVEIIERIVAWRKRHEMILKEDGGCTHSLHQDDRPSMHSSLPFYFQGQNYLIKMINDVSFVYQDAPDMVRWMEFPMRRNPLFCPYTLDDDAKVNVAPLSCQVITTPSNFGSSLTNSISATKNEIKQNENLGSQPSSPCSLDANKQNMHFSTHLGDVDMSRLQDCVHTLARESFLSFSMETSGFATHSRSTTSSSLSTHQIDQKQNKEKKRNQKNRLSLQPPGQTHTPIVPDKSGEQQEGSRHQSNAIDEITSNVAKNRIDKANKSTSQLMLEDILRTQSHEERLEKELIIFQSKVKSLTLSMETMESNPVKKRRVYQQIRMLNNEVRFRSSDLYKRKNELLRKKRIFLMTKDSSLGRVYEDVGVTKMLLPNDAVSDTESNEK